MCHQLTPQRTFEIQPVSTVMQNQLDFDYDDRWTMTIAVAAWTVGFHILTALALRFISHLKR